MPEPIVFYDIPGKDTSLKCWSPNTWKTRYTLNVKGIPYKTVWVEYPDIEAVLRKIGALPTEHKADGSPLYTLPAIYDPNTKTALAESAAIVRYLDKTYPDTPRLIPAGTDALHAAFNQAFRSVLGEDLHYSLVAAVANSLPPRSEAYFRTTREARFGVKLEELAPPGPKREKHWSGVQHAFHTYAQWLETDGTDKLFFTGDKIAYADVTIAAYLVWLRVILGADSKEWADLRTWDGGRWGRFMDAFEKYETVDAGEDAIL
ncbi:hypothetical protein BV20DRAFT_940572 [Pilatotrama ljubarskyi]|nr:hypothetical protein BV20DRAFT_940572 [Pilatotrama ljubarskyi]